MPNAPRDSGSIFGNRQGGEVVRHSFKLSATTSTTATKLPFAPINATADQPVMLEAQIAVITADGGTSPTLSVGFTGAGYTDLVNAASTASGAAAGVFLPASNATGKKIVTALTDLYYIQGGTPDGAGVVWIIVDVTPLNTRT